MAKHRRRRAHHTVKAPSRSSGFTFQKAKPWIAMLVGGTAGLVGAGLAPDGVRPYLPAVGVVVAKFFGGGGWTKYLATSAVVGGLSFVARRRFTKVAAGALLAAKRQLLASERGGGGGGGRGVFQIPSSNEGSAAERGNQILKNAGLKS